MSASEFDTVWILISKHRFEINDDFSHEDLKCILCKKLMIDACQGLCGCHYCYNCIRDYIGGECKYCPGGKADCKLYPLNIHENITRNKILNKKISNLKVYCPNQSCGCEIELINMNNHLRVCSKQPIICPFATIGCGNENANKDTIETHLCDNYLPHTELLIEYVHNLKNEFNELRLDFEKSKLEITEKENRIMTLERELKAVDIRMKKEAEVQRRGNDEIRKDVNVMRKKREKYDEKMWSKMNNLFKICPNVDVDFVWRVDRKKEVMFSESFNVHNYRLCLSRRVSNHGYLIFGCCVMRGDNDARVEWPMKRVVTISILDRSTFESHDIDTLSFDAFNGGDKRAFDRPINERNTAEIGPYSCENAPIGSWEGLLDNEVFVVTCVVTDPR